MSGTTWSKFFWSDWQYDPSLRLCSFAARGLWMDMLCIAAAHDPIGYVAVAGRGLSETDIARMTGGTESEVTILLGELDRNGVFSRDRHGRIYSRRMVLDAKKAAEARKNGKKGGNPTLGKTNRNPAPVNPHANHPDKGSDNPHKPEAIIQERFGPNGPAGSASPPDPRKADVDRLWSLAPARGRERSSRKDVERALRAALRRGASVDQIVGGVEGYYASEGATKDGGDFAKGLHRLIENDRWQEYAPTGGLFVSTTSPRSAFGPRLRNPPEDQQRAWMRDIREGFEWKEHDRGPKPGQPGCQVSAEIQREFGVEPAKPQPVGGRAA